MRDCRMVVGNLHGEALDTPSYRNRGKKSPYEYIKVGGKSHDAGMQPPPLTNRASRAMMVVRGNPQGLWLIVSGFRVYTVAPTDPPSQRR